MKKRNTGRFPPCSLLDSLLSDYTKYESRSGITGAVGSIVPSTFLAQHLAVGLIALMRGVETFQQIPSAIAFGTIEVAIARRGQLLHLAERGGESFVIRG
jgi:hypothetical protein